jgi:hypothetical protein
MSKLYFYFSPCALQHLRYHRSNRIVDFYTKFNHSTKFWTAHLVLYMTPKRKNQWGYIGGAKEATIMGYTDRPRDIRIQQLFYFVYIRCLANMFTEPLHSNNKKDTHTDTQAYGRNICSTPLRCSGAMICIPSFIKIDLGVQ